MFKVKYNNKEGWFSIDDLYHLYLFSDDKVREQYQARFDPHRKINILNTSWARPEYGSDKTNISFKLQNLSPYPVNNIVVTVSIKDSNGAVQRKEIFNIQRNNSSKVIPVLFTPLNQNLAAKNRLYSLLVPELGKDGKGGLKCQRPYLRFH